MTVSTQFRDDLRGEEKARIAEIIWGASIPTCLPLFYYSRSLFLSLFLSLSAISPPPFDPLCTSFYVFPRATETALRAVCVHTSADYLLLPLTTSNYFRPAAYKRPSPSMGSND